MNEQYGEIDFGYLSGIELWDVLQDPTVLDQAQEYAATLRNATMPDPQISVRKTIGLNEPGCSVDCGYCTLGRQYTNVSNKNALRPNLEEDIDVQLRGLPAGVPVELVGYWYGINDVTSESFDRIEKLVQRLSQNHVVGADLGIITEPRVLRRLKEAGLTYLHNHLETTRDDYHERIGKDPKRYDAKIETLRLANEVGLRMTSGILIGVGETANDLDELTRILSKFPLSRIMINFMDYSDSRISGRYADCKDQLTPEYALRVLTFLRLKLRPDQSLGVGSGVGSYLYSDETLPRVAKIVDTLHVGAFINLNPVHQGVNLFDRLNGIGYEIVEPNYFNQIRTSDV